MNILVLEDRAMSLQSMKELLVDKHHKIYECSDIYDANKILTTLENDINCFIIDLAMDPEGLKDINLIERTENGNYTGWVWVDEIVLKRNKKLKDRIIIFSAYIGEFESYMKQYNIKDIFILSKGDPEWRKKLGNKLDELQSQSNS